MHDMQNNALDTERQTVSFKTVTPDEAGQRLDNILIRILKGVPRTHIYRLIRKGEVRINKKRAKPESKLNAGDIIRLPPVRTSAPKEKLVMREDLEVYLTQQIIFEDERLLVLNKPSGMAVHGGSGVSFGVIEALRAMRPETHYLELVHRLDRETSGCLLVAKKRSMLRAIQALFEKRLVQKQYWLLSEGSWYGKPSCTVKAPLRKNILKSGERMVCIDGQAGKPSETRFQLIENFPEKSACWLLAEPKTGRTHQIRVHAASLEHPIIGDTKYGQQTEEKNRLYLHAQRIQFTLDGRPYIFEADWDTSCDEKVQSLRANKKSK